MFEIMHIFESSNTLTLAIDRNAFSDGWHFQHVQLLNLILKKWKYATSRRYEHLGWHLEPKNIVHTTKFRVHAMAPDLPNSEAHASIRHTKTSAIRILRSRTETLAKPRIALKLPE